MAPKKRSLFEMVTRKRVVPKRFRGIPPYNPLYEGHSSHHAAANVLKRAFRNRITYVNAARPGGYDYRQAKKRFYKSAAMQFMKRYNAYAGRTRSSRK